MSFKTIKKFAILLLLITSSSNLMAQNTIEAGKEFPNPTGNTNQLFYLQRNENTNTVIYELNEKNGIVDNQNPVHVFWIMYAKQKQHQELSEMENKFAYGIKIKPLIKDEYQFTLVAYPKITLQLKKDMEQKYHVYVTPLKQEIILDKVFIKVKEGGLSLKPNVEYIDFVGKDLLTGKEITERIIP